jgi:Mg-chelatase subunit ChlD
MCAGRLALVAVTISAGLVAACGGPPPNNERGPIPPRELDRLVESLAPASSIEQRDGLAAVILIDVSTSMGETPQHSREPKIISARRAAVDLVRQFERYAGGHPGEPVLLSIYEFSERRGQHSAREVVPMGPPRTDRAEPLIMAMKANGGTPIGEAMIAGKRALDATGLVRRHLLVITDGENRDGVSPERVAAAIAKRPEAERPSLYFVAFDIDAGNFERVKQSGALVLEAEDSRALNSTLDALLSEEILVER